MMSELKQKNGREVSFKEIFYEANMDSVSDVAEKFKKGNGL